MSMAKTVAPLWLIDTCVASEIPKLSPNPLVITWLEIHRAECALSAVSVGEIEYGLLRMPAGARRLRLLGWFDRLCQDFAPGILPCDLLVWREFARLKSETEQIGRPQEDMDLLIAATALTHGLTLVTRNTKHFADTGCKLYNPWQDGTAD
jgi:toxin FitB